MRILTVRQPWAWAIIHAGKDVENRVRNIARGYRGPVAIHAGLAKFDDEGQYREVTRAIVSELNGWPADDGELWGADSIEADDTRFVYGAIIGTVELVDVHPAGAYDCATRTITEYVDPFHLTATVTTPCSPWAEPDTWHLRLANPRALAEPIPYRGALGLRTLDDQTTAQIRHQLEEHTAP